MMFGKPCTGHCSSLEQKLNPPERKPPNRTLPQRVGHKQNPKLNHPTCPRVSPTWDYSVRGMAWYLQNVRFFFWRGLSVTDKPHWCIHQYPTLFISLVPVDDTLAFCHLGDGHREVKGFRKVVPSLESRIPGLIPNRMLYLLLHTLPL